MHRINNRIETTLLVSIKKLIDTLKDTVNRYVMYLIAKTNKYFETLFTSLKKKIYIHLFYTSNIK